MTEYLIRVHSYREKKWLHIVSLLILHASCEAYYERTTKPDIIDKSLDTVGGLHLQRHSRRPKWKWRQ